MGSRKTRQQLSLNEIKRAFTTPDGTGCGPIVSPKALADIVELSVSTIYHWIQLGRLDGCFRKRGKHILIWRDCAINTLFNGPDWEQAYE